MKQFFKPLTAVVTSLAVLALAQTAVAAAPGNNSGSKQPTVQKKSNKMARCGYTYNMTTCKVQCSPAPCHDFANKCGSAVQGCKPKAQKARGLGR